MCWRGVSRSALKNRDGQTAGLLAASSRFDVPPKKNTTRDSDVDGDGCVSRSGGG